MARFLEDERAATLLAPIRAQLAPALDALPAGPTLTVGVGDVDGFYALEGDRLTLSASLEGPGLHHPAEPAGPLPPMDRWRRALCAALEAASLSTLRAAGADGPEWMTLGAAIEAADMAAPGLGLILPALARAAEGAALSADPRAGAAIARAWRQRGEDPSARALGAPPEAGEWLELGEAVRRLGAELPVPVERPPARAAPLDLAPWSWGRVHVEPHPRGGRLVGGPVSDPWVIAETEHRAHVGALATQARIQLAPGFPARGWAMASGRGFGQLMGARGLEFRFGSWGDLQILLADAFVGPLDGLAMAETVGTSGVINARWAIAGSGQIRIFGLVPSGLTVHGRAEENNFAVPAPGAGLESYLNALEGSEWAWRQRGEQLVLSGDSLGAPIELRFRVEVE